MGNEEERKEQRRTHKSLAKLRPAHPPPHLKTRGRHPAYPARLAVSEEQVRWSVHWPYYSPPTYTHPTVFANARTEVEGGRKKRRAASGTTFICMMAVRNAESAFYCNNECVYWTYGKVV